MDQYVCHSLAVEKYEIGVGPIHVLFSGHGASAQTLNSQVITVLGACGAPAQADNDSLSGGSGNLFLMEQQLEVFPWTAQPLHLAMARSVSTVGI